MAIRHIGYGVVDTDGDVFIDSDMFVSDNLDESYSDAEYLKKIRDINWVKSSPHKIVRVLVDDELENG